MTVQDIINNFEQTDSEGFQVSKRNGLLSITFLMYFKSQHIYIFDMNENIDFSNHKNRYSKEIFVKEFENTNFQIDCEII